MFILTEMTKTYMSNYKALLRVVKLIHRDYLYVKLLSYIAF